MLFTVSSLPRVLLHQLRGLPSRVSRHRMGYWSSVMTFVLIFWACVCSASAVSELREPAVVAEDDSESNRPEDSVVGNDETHLTSDVATYAPRPSNRVELSSIYHRALRALYDESNLTEALTWIRRGATMGHGRLHWLLGVMHATGVGVPQSDAHAILHYKFAALESVPEAHMALGSRYSGGIGTPRNCQLAAAHLREAADAVAMTFGGPAGSTTVAKTHALFGGRWGSSSDDKAFHTLMYRADGGATDAIMELGYMFLRGRNGQQGDRLRARSYFLKALEMGDDAAYGALGQLYATEDGSEGSEVGRDLAVAASYFSKGAVKEEPTSLNGMGYMHAIGFYENDKLAERVDDKRQPDFKTAAKYFRKSANRGNTEAIYNLGVLKLHGRGVPQDPSSAIKLFEHAAVRGSILSVWQLARHAQTRGNCQRAVLLYNHVVSHGSMFSDRGNEPYFPRSDGVPFTPTADSALVQLLERLALAETGHAESRHQAARMLVDEIIEEEEPDELLNGVFAKSGRPPARAVRQETKGTVYLQWYDDSRARLQQNPARDMVLSGKEVDKGGNHIGQKMLLSQREAFHMLKLRLLQLSALSGNSDSELQLGDFYYNGRSRLIGVDMVKALLHYEAAAGSNNAKALFNAGFMHQLALGVSGTTRQPASVWDAFIGIVTNTALDLGESEGAEVFKGLSIDPLILLERRLYLAKRFYDHVGDVDRGLGLYAVKFARMSLNFQWWWLYFCRHQYGFSRFLRLPMPTARFDEYSVRAVTAEEASTRTPLEGVPPPEMIKGWDNVWGWDDYLLVFSAALLFLCLLLRHHGA